MPKPFTERTVQRLENTSLSYNSFITLLTVWLLRPQYIHIMFSAVIRYPQINWVSVKQQIRVALLGERQMKPRHLIDLTTMHLRSLSDKQ